MTTLKEKVLYCLNKHQDTRNSDIKLTNAVWIEYHNSVIFKENGEYAVRLKDLYNIPREDNVKRLRAIIKNKEHKFLPTSLEVVKRRKMNEKVWERYIQQEYLYSSNPATG